MNLDHIRQISKGALDISRAYANLEGQLRMLNRVHKLLDPDLVSTLIDEIERQQKLLDREFKEKI